MLDAFKVGIFYMNIYLNRRLFFVNKDTNTNAKWQIKTELNLFPHSNLCVLFIVPPYTKG